MNTKEKIAALLQKQADIRGKVKAENREFTKEEAEELRGILDQVTTLNEQLELEERADKIEAEMRKSAPGQNVPKIDPAESGVKVTNIHERSDDDPTGGFRNMGDFAVDVMNYGRNSRTSKAFQNWVERENRSAGDGMTATVDSEGGVLIPTGFSTMLLEKGLEQNNIIQRCTAVPMETASVDMPYIVDKDRSSGYVFGNIKMYWVDEEGAGTATKINTGNIKLNLHSLVGLVYASDKLLTYSPVSMETIFRVKMPQAISYALTDAILTGTGAGRPSGITVAPCTVEVTAETGQAADTIVFENITKMFARLDTESYQGAVWVANNDTLPQLMSMYIAVGTGGMPVWLPPTGAASAPFGTIMGRPLILTELMPKLGDSGDIMLANFGEYLLGMPSANRGTQFASSIHLKFDYLQTAFRFKMDVDGQPWWASARTPRRSASTVSPFVKLAAR